MAIIELSTSDPGELGSLRGHLRRDRTIEVTQCAGTPGPGELGVWDFLQVTAASGGVLAVALRTIPEFIRSRRRDVSVSVKVRSEEGDKEITVSAANAEDAMRLLERTLDG